jgi:hypothetical protein
MVAAGATTCAGKIAGCMEEAVLTSWKVNLQAIISLRRSSCGERGERDMLPGGVQTMLLLSLLPESREFGRLVGVHPESRRERTTRCAGVHK